jgi:hypothetical protein
MVAHDWLTVRLAGLDLPYVFPVLLHCWLCHRLGSYAKVTRQGLNRQNTKPYEIDDTLVGLGFSNCGDKVALQNFCDSEISGETKR